MTSTTPSAIVTGGASGLGAATARRLQNAGYEVVVLDMEIGHLDPSTGLHPVKGDVVSESDVARAVEAAVAFGPLRAVINCAGISRPGRTLARNGDILPLDTFLQVMNVNLAGTFNVIRLAAAAMAKFEPDEGGERGSVVMTASCAAFDGQAGQVPYAAAKSGIRGMTLPLARDLAPVGIRVNTIAPGTFDTPMFSPPQHVLEKALPERVEKFRQLRKNLEADVLFPSRLGFPDEFADLAFHMVTNRYLNGEVVRLDGGLRMRAK
jgi:NAD(P)-dependent dehydrogenase (short-subunit alcohol dehydrogenase family)